jgi:translocation and assembly module TamB
VRLQKDVPIDVQVKVEDVDLGEILERVAVPGAWVTVKLDGTGRVAGTILPAAIDARLDLQARRFRSLTGPWRAARASDQAMLEFERGRLSVPFHIRDEGITFEKAHIEVGAGRADVDARVAFNDAKGFEVVATGEVDLDALHHVAGIPWGGRAAVVVRAAAAPYGNPRIDATVKAEQLHFMLLDLGSATFDAAYGPDHTLRLSGIEGTRGQARYEGFATVDLGATPVRIPASRFTASGPLHDLCDAVMAWLPSTRILRDAMDGQVVELTGLASGPAKLLDVDFEGRLGPGRLLGRRFDSGRLVGQIRAGAEATFKTLELRFGPGTASATGRWGFLGPMPWDLRLALAGVPAAALDLPGGSWGGSLSGTATLAGSFDVPDVHFAVNGDAVSLRGASLGTVQLGGTVVGRRLQVTGAADGARFTGQAQLEGRVPFSGRADLDLKDATRLWPGGPPQGLKVAVEGTASAEGELVEPLAARGRVALERLSAAYADLKLENAGPLAIAFDRGRVQVDRFAVRGVNTEFSLVGAVAPSGALDLQAQGSLDLRLLGGVLPALRSPRGRLAVQAHVGGTVDEPVLLGDGRLEEAGFQLRGGKANFTDLAGPLTFSQNKVVFDGLTARVNHGGLVLSGEVELDRLVPSRLRIDGQLDEVDVALPTYLPSVLSGRLEAAGTLDETVVTGRLHVLRSRYTLNVDIDKRLVGLGRRATPLRAYDVSGEWLRFDLQLAVDGDVRVENDMVSGAMQGELTLTGSLASPGLVGSLSMLPGGRARFRGNEFDVTRALVDFKDRNDILPTIDANGEARVSDYQVLVHLYGSLIDSNDFHADLSSTPPLSQPDLITLITVGYARQDTAGGANLSGLGSSAANQALLGSATQALLQVSGFDEVVKRFLPRGGPLTDFTVRTTTLYSNSTGVLEPGLAMETWVLPNRLRLRAQVPFTASDYRVQGELKLSEHASAQLQYDSARLQNLNNAVIGNLTLPGDVGADLKLRWEWNR